MYSEIVLNSGGAKSEVQKVLGRGRRRIPGGSGRERETPRFSSPVKIRTINRAERRRKKEKREKLSDGARALAQVARITAAAAAAAAATQRYDD